MYTQCFGEQGVVSGVVSWLVPGVLTAVHKLYNQESVKYCIQRSHFLVKVRQGGSPRETNGAELTGEQHETHLLFIGI